MCIEYTIISHITFAKQNEAQQQQNNVDWSMNPTEAEPNHQQDPYAGMNQQSAYSGFFTQNRYPQQQTQNTWSWK